MTQWIRVRHPATGGEAIQPEGALPALTAVGWEPFGEPAATAYELLLLADQEKADAAEAAKAQAEAAADAAQDGKVADVLAAVADDPPAARAALDAELAKDRPRSTLVAQLEQIAHRDAQASTDEGVTGG